MRDGASDAELAEIIARVWKNRDDRYSELRSKVTEFADPKSDKIEMYYIGG